jgi:hypothetical protein
MSYRGSTLAFVTNSLAIIAVVLSAVAIAVSVWTGMVNRRSAVAAEASATASDRSADAAQESAMHARRSADAAERVAGVEAARDHEMYRPKPPDMSTAVVHDKSGARSSRFLTFTVDRTYRVAGDVIRGEGRSRLGPDPFIEAGKEVRVFLDDKAGRADSVNIRFWPAAADDPGERWSCPCGGPTEQDGPVHWEWNLPVPNLPTPATGRVGQVRPGQTRLGLG